MILKSKNKTGKPQGKSVIKQGHRLRHTSRRHYTIADPGSDRTNNFTRSILTTVTALQGCVEFRPARAHAARQTHSNSNQLLASQANAAKTNSHKQSLTNTNTSTLM